jgi:hypothetical protein
VDTDGSRRLHANNMSKYNTRLVATAVENCAVIYDDDTDFENIETVEMVSQVDELPCSKISDESLNHSTSAE